MCCWWQGFDDGLSPIKHKIDILENFNFKGAFTYYVTQAHYRDGSGKYHLHVTLSVKGSS